MEKNFGAFGRACSRRDFLKLSGITAFTVAGATFLTGCGPAAQSAGSNAGSSKSGSSKKAAGKLGDGKTLRIGMEAAYAPYNWQESKESDTTIPIENVSGAYADGYDVQIAKRIAKALDMEPVAVKMEFGALVDALGTAPSTSSAPACLSRPSAPSLPTSPIPTSMTK